MQGAGREAVVNLPQAACNTADAAKVTRPKGEIFDIQIGEKSLTPLMTVCVLQKRLNFVATDCV
ncbi:hypothetical protein [Desulfosudis oleivorans]|uniref:hypothetical protein n=1 Tax=Desulfosudis oleivorans TaxID=181663 RepID=UPI001ABFE28B|nr:hypothetical protein [Desulfosudis oleivorans]